MPEGIQFDPVQLPGEAEAMRLKVRRFLEQEISAGHFEPR
ncbi:uncharacterized protein METZ01_LOCUS498009, partial [marine metagenome]